MSISLFETIPVPEIWGAFERHFDQLEPSPSAPAALIDQIKWRLAALAAKSAHTQFKHFHFASVS
jgi:hypothetical protein